MDIVSHCDEVKCNEDQAAEAVPRVVVTSLYTMSYIP